MVKKLVAFDFDGTLANTPMPEEGMKIWKEKTGKDYPYSGWWGRPESLDTNIFDIRMFDNIHNILKKEKQNPDTYVIILTSRMEKLRTELENVLRKNGVVVDEVRMKRSNRSKGEKILDYIDKFPELEEIDVYEDRQVDILSYRQIEGRIPSKIRFNIYLANNGQNELLEPQSKLTNVILDELRKLY